MKDNLILMLVILILGNSCTSNEIEISKSYVDITIDGSPGPWLVHDDKFYCFFEKDNWPYSTARSPGLFIYNRNGELLKMRKAPKPVRVNYDLFLKNDSVFVMDYYDNITFYINDAYEFIETERQDDLIYEDSDYYVTSIDQGEWGGRTWFRNKFTNREFELGMSTPVVNFYDEKYYLTIPNGVWEVANPEKMREAVAPRDYQTTFLTDTIFFDYPEPQGVVEVYQDTVYWLVSDFKIVTSAVHKDKLIHWCVDSSFSYLAEVQNDSMVPIYHFEENLWPWRKHFHIRNRISGNNYQSIQFNTDDEKVFGIAEFEKDKIRMTYFRNHFEIPNLGAYRAKKVFLKMFDFYSSNLENLYLDTVDSIEQNLQSLDLTQDHHISTYLNKGHDLATPQIYKKFEQSTFILLSEYYYSRSNKKVQIVTFNWDEIDLEEYGLNDPLATDNPNAKKFDEKWEWLEKVIAERFGSPVRDDGKTPPLKLEWEKNGIKIILSKSELKIRLSICAE